MQISVVIPTVDRKMRLVSLLASLDRSTHPIHEVIIVDSGNERLAPNEYSAIKNFPIYYIPSERSVCIQRNIGIKQAKSKWIFLCDDDIEVPTDYLAKITGHILKNPQAGAVSGLVLQKEKDDWRSEYPEKTFGTLLWKYIFKLSIWGSIQCKGNNFLLKKIKKYYLQKGNHISKAGWPVLTNFSGDYFVAPVFGLGASVVKKDWLQNSPYDEVLDSHGIGDHYGVAAGFPATGIHILNDAFVYHHQETTNRLSKPLQYYRRVLALDYFIKTGKKNKMSKRRWLFWSLCGNKVSFLFAANLQMIWANLKAMLIILSGQNPYSIAAKNKTKITEPKL